MKTVSLNWKLQELRIIFFIFYFFNSAEDTVNHLHTVIIQI